jgi:hypothetical protein
VEVTATSRDTARRPIGGWFTRRVMSRIYTKNNVLLLITGATGIGKSYCGLKLCELYDPHFDSSRIVFDMKDFLELIPVLPTKSFVLFDECGVNIGHRSWLSPANMAISMVTQSFRHKFINVIFALPSRFYLDKVPREMAHYEIMMQRRGVGAVYNIYKSSFVDATYPKYQGTLFLGLPSKQLCDEYENKREQNQNALYERLLKEQEVLTQKQDEKLEKALQPKRTFEDDVEKGMLILPQLVDTTKDSDQGLIDVHKLRRSFDSIGIKLAHNRGYNIRKELLRRLHANDNQLLKKLKGDSIVSDSHEQ